MTSYFFVMIVAVFWFVIPKTFKVLIFSREPNEQIKRYYYIVIALVLLTVLDFMSHVYLSKGVDSGLIVFLPCFLYIVTWAYWALKYTKTYKYIRENYVAFGDEEYQEKTLKSLECVVIVIMTASIPLMILIAMS